MFPFEIPTAVLHYALNKAKTTEGCTYLRFYA